MTRISHAVTTINQISTEYTSAHAKCRSACSGWGHILPHFALPCARGRADSKITWGALMLATAARTSLVTAAGVLALLQAGGEGGGPKDEGGLPKARGSLANVCIATSHDC